MHGAQPTVPLWWDLYPVGRGQLPHFPQGTRLHRNHTFKCEITNKYLIFGRLNSKVFKWKEPVRNITINKFKTYTPSTSANPAYLMAPPPTPTGRRQGSTPLIHPGQRKNNQQATRSCPHPEPLFPRILRHPWRKDTPRNDHTASSCKTKPNANRFRGPRANPTLRLHGQNNTAPGGSLTFRQVHFRLVTFRLVHFCLVHFHLNNISPK